MSVALKNSPHSIAEAGRVLRAGGTVAFPTETVYGLGADATSPDAVARIYAAKGRPRFNPLISHVSSLDAAEAEGVFTSDARRLADAFWPGPLTLVLPRHSQGTVCDLACAGLESIALRIPAHAIARAILEAAGRPIAAPSANRSGRISPTEAAHVAADLGEVIDLVVDGGACQVGIESTIVACLDDRITLLRSGGLPRDTIETALGRGLDDADRSAITAPGMLASHYAPRAKLRLNATSIRPNEVGLDFAGSFGGPGLDLSTNGDPREAAANLYRMLRAIDSGNLVAIAVAPIPDEGLGAAINDRLARAAAPRDA